MIIKRILFWTIGIIAFSFLGMEFFKNYSFNPNHNVGEKIDSLNHVYVFYNGGVDHIGDRNLTKDGYNLGLEFQCVEFVKRYYFLYLDHKMPDAYGHAKDFFDIKIKDGQKNLNRNLIQYTNPSKKKPEVNDLLIFDGTLLNKYGHVAIISRVTENEIEIIQQNPGPYSDSREIFALDNKDGKWEIKNNRLLGWLRKEQNIE